MYSRVYVEITNICNMNCSFCHGHSRDPRQMTEEEYAQVLAQLQGKTQYIYHHLMGEPLVHPLLPKFVKMAKAAGFRPMLTTNGTLLGEDLLMPELQAAEQYQQEITMKELKYYSETYRQSTSTCSVWDT